MEARLRLCLARFLLLLFPLTASGSKHGGAKLAPVDSYILLLERSQKWFYPSHVTGKAPVGTRAYYEN